MSRVAIDVDESVRKIVGVLKGMDYGVQWLIELDPKVLTTLLCSSGQDS